MSPFHDVGLVPGEPFEATAAVIMLAVAVLSAAVAVGVFARRDLKQA